MAMTEWLGQTPVLQNMTKTMVLLGISLDNVHREGEVLYDSMF